MADFYWAPSGHPFRVELRFTTSASPSQEGSALFATDFPRYTRSRWTKKDRDRLGDRFVDESSRCVVPGELLQPLRSRLRVNPLAVSARRSCNPAANAEITLGSNPMALASASSTRSMSVQRETRFASTHGHGHDLPSNRAGATIRSVQMPKALSPTGHRSSRTTLRMIHTHCASEHHRLARRPFNAAFTVAS